MSSDTDATAAPPKAGFIILCMKEWDADITNEKKGEYVGLMKPYLGKSIEENGGKEGGSEVIFMGMASRMYEVAGLEQQPNMAILKYPTVEIANAVAKGMPDRTGFVKRDLRVIEAPADMFAKKNTSYLIATVESVIDEEKTKAYFGSFKEQNAKGYQVTYPNSGEVKPVSIVLKVMAPAFGFYDDTTVGEGKQYLTLGPDNTAMTTVAEFPDLQGGLNLFESDDFKDTVFKVLGEEMTAENKTKEGFKEVEKRFCATVLRRGIRVIELLETPKEYPTYKPVP